MVRGSARPVELHRLVVTMKSSVVLVKTPGQIASAPMFSVLRAARGVKAPLADNDWDLFETEGFSGGFYNKEVMAYAQQLKLPAIVTWMPMADDEWHANPKAGYLTAALSYLTKNKHNELVKLPDKALVEWRDVTAPKKGIPLTELYALYATAKNVPIGPRGHRAPLPGTTSYFAPRDS